MRLISKSDVDAIVERKAVPDSPVLSVYLDIDQSKAVNLKRRFEASLKDMLRSHRRHNWMNQSRSFSADAGACVNTFPLWSRRQRDGSVLPTIRKIFSGRARSRRRLARLSRAGSETPYIAPMLEILDEYERYGVVLADKEQARLFTVFIGEIAEHYDAFAPAPVKHFKTTGTDQWLSAAALPEAKPRCTSIGT